jgi:hypothetical protein
LFVGTNAALPAGQYGCWATPGVVAQRS